MFMDNLAADHGGWEYQNGAKGPDIFAPQQPDANAVSAARLRSRSVQPGQQPVVQKCLMTVW